jgi:hypothetical protein
MVRVVGALAALVGAFALGGAVSAMSRLPDLKPWHHLVTSLEPRAGDIGEGFTLDDYLRREDAVFAEARQQVEAVVAASADPLVPNRYVAASRSAPSRFATESSARTCSGSSSGVRVGAPFRIRIGYGSRPLRAGTSGGEYTVTPWHTRTAQFAGRSIRPQKSVE